MPSHGGLAAENELIRAVAREVTALNCEGRAALLINLGAGPAAVLESRLAAARGINSALIESMSRCAGLNTRAWADNGRRASFVCRGFPISTTT